MKDYDKNKEYWDVNNLYDWAMLQKLPVNNFRRIKDSSQFHDDFLKNYNEESDTGYFFLKLMPNILKNYMNFIMAYYLYLKE